MNKKTQTKKKPEPIVVRSAFSPRVPVTIECGPSLTKQSFAEEVNVNNIMRRFTNTGVIEHVNHRQPNYGFCTGEDFRTALETIQAGNDSFANLPADLRQEFNNNPAEFFDFVLNPDNKPQLAEMGLLSPEATEELNNRPPELPTPPEAAPAAENGQAKPAGDPPD